MNFRALLVGPVLALTWLAAARAPAALSDTPTGQGERREALFPAQRFRFDAGAPLVAPAGVAPDGTLCVGTVDGYVHALAADGLYLWSRSVHGGVLRRPLFVGQLWYVSTSAERVYALSRDGSLYWVFKPLNSVSSELAADASGTLYYVGADRFLYGVSSHGGVSLRATFGELKAGPTQGPDGAVWLENQAGSVLRVTGRDVRRFPPGTRPDFSFPDPEVLRDPEGRVWQARSDGVLELRETAQAQPSLLTLTRSPLFAPAWSAVARYAVLSSRSGLLFAVEPMGIRRSR